MKSILASVETDDLHSQLKSPYTVLVLYFVILLQF